MNRRKRFPVRSLPYGINLADFDFVPTPEEKLWDRLQKLKKVWDKEDDRRRKRRAREIELEIFAAREKQAAEDAAAERAAAANAEIEKRRSYFLKANEAESAVTEKLLESYDDQLDGGKRKKLLAALERITKETKRDDARLERDELLRRGVVRGRR